MCCFSESSSGSSSPSRPRPLPRPPPPAAAVLRYSSTGRRPSSATLTSARGPARDHTYLDAASRQPDSAVAGKGEGKGGVAGHLSRAARMRAIRECLAVSSIPGPLLDCSVWNFSSSPPSPRSLCEELHRLMRVMWSGKWAVVTPHTVLNAIWQLIPSFHGYTQQDAQEFLWYVIYSSLEGAMKLKFVPSCSP